jgi:predicted kinase
MQVIIMRGASGSGKSTYVAKNFPSAKVVSADKFFEVTTIWEYGRTSVDYRFDPTKLGEAHAWCLNQFIEALYRKEPLIVVDNSNIRIWEFANYVLLARKYGAQVRVLTIEPTQFSALELVERNVHKVPIELISKMIATFEPFDGQEFI